MNNFRLKLIFRILLLSGTIFLEFYLWYSTELSATIVILGIVIIIEIISLINYVDSTNRELSRFLLSIKYSDFSQTFARTKLGGSFKELHHEFEEVIKKFRDTRSEKEEHYRYLQTVMQHVGVGLISFKQDGKVEFINNAAKKLLKVAYLNNIESLDKRYSGVGTQILDARPGNKSTIKFVESNELVQLIIYATEFKLRDHFYKLVSLQNIQSELEEQEMLAWQKLIRVLTHEIMNSITPISSLSATVNTMLSSCYNGEELDEETIKDIQNAVTTINKRSEGLIHFVENYRSLTRIPKPDFRVFKISSLFERINKLMETNLKGKEIYYTSSVTPETLELTADPEQIEQVLINLLLNSVQSLENKYNGVIELTAGLNERGSIMIRVYDNGPGIPEDIQEKIFIPFFTTKKEGSGIGLSLSRQIIRAHKGSIRCASKPGEGTLFTLKF